MEGGLDKPTLNKVYLMLCISVMYTALLLVVPSFEREEPLACQIEIWKRHLNWVESDPSIKTANKAHAYTQD